MPYGGSDEQKRKHFSGVFQGIIIPAAEKAGYVPKRSDITAEPGNITHDIIQDLANSDMVIADLTGANPNVFFELGVRHAFRKSGTVHIIDQEHDIPFDIRQYRAIEYTTDLADIPQTIEKIVDAIQRRESQPERPDNPVHDAIKDLPMDIRSTGDSALRNQLEKTQNSLETIQSEKDELYQKLVELDPSLSFRDTETEIDFDALLDNAEAVMKSSGENVLLRLKNSLTEGGKDLFVKELRSVLKSPYLEENDFTEIVKICRQLGLDGHRRATLEIARARYPFSESILIQLIDAYDDSKNPQDNTRGRLMVEEYLKIKHQEGGPILSTSTTRHQRLALQILFNFYNKANKSDWILSIADSADRLDMINSIIERTRAVTLNKLRRFDEAEQSFIRALELEPTDDVAMRQYASFLDDQAKYEESYALYEKAIIMDSEDGRTFISLGIHILNRGIVRDEDGNFIGPLSKRDIVKAVVPFFIRCIQLSPSQGVVQEIVGILVRADAIYEAEAFASGDLPDGTYNQTSLNHVDRLIASELGG